MFSMTYQYLYSFINQSYYVAIHREGTLSVSARLSVRLYCASPNSRMASSQRVWG